MGEGDCDSDDDCLGTLVCSDGLDNCQAMGVPGMAWETLSGGGRFSGTDDCCTFSPEVMEFLETY